MLHKHIKWGDSLWDYYYYNYEPLANILSWCSQEGAVISHRLRVSGSYIDARQAPKDSIFRPQTVLDFCGGLNNKPGCMNEISTFQREGQAPARERSIEHASPSSPFLVDRANTRTPRNTLQRLSLSAGITPLVNKCQWAPRGVRSPRLME